MNLEIFEQFYASRHAEGWLVDISQVMGYSDNELVKIEKLYDIKICSDFRKFMLVMGRCSGGGLGDDPIILYRSLWSVRAQILFQVNFFNDMQEIGKFEYLNKPFVFSRESETQYFFLVTGLDCSNAVYHYDENNQTVCSTGLSFMDYMQDVVKRYAGHGHNVICRGELLVI